MHKLTIHQAAEREAAKAAAIIANEKIALREWKRAYDAAVIRLAQDLENEKRGAWASARKGAKPISEDDPLMQQLRDWLSDAKNTDRRIDLSGGKRFATTRQQYAQPAIARASDDWTRKLFIADDAEVSTWPFMNRDHQNFAPELEAAVSAWIALYGSGELNKKKGARALVPDWLKKNKADSITSPTARERIASVVAPAHRKTGGAMPSGKK